MRCTNLNLRITLLFLFITLFTACNRHYSVQNNIYKEYGIDQTAEVDSSFVRMYLPYKQKMDAEMSTVLGQCAQPLTKPSSSPETLLGNFFADVILAEGRKKDPGIDFSFGTKGGLRTTLPKGDITYRNIFELMPFENELVVLTLPGKNVLSLIDFIIRKGGEPVSGLRMKVRDNKPYDITIGGRPFDVNQHYQLLTYDYLANGGDDLESLRNAIASKQIDNKVREAIIEHIKDLTRNGKTINSKLDGRIVIE
jgi:2',3'-cyclic-nucleotide 2'-phosphodiesterase (5'-nucleotidase family)